jgi:Na+-transporting methylmalonyl-CoA/oxaloacetate decarboxylase gamma subunit
MLVAALLVFVVFILILVLVSIRFCAPLANEAGEKQTTHPTTTQETAGNQQAEQPTMLVATLLVFVVFILILVLVSIRFRAPLANEVGEKQTTHPTTTQETARNQHAQQPTMLVTTLLVFVVFILILILILVSTRFCAPLANEAGEKQTTHPTTTQETARNQHAQQPAILAAAPFLFAIPFTAFT